MLTEAFVPSALEVHDESHMHSVPKGAESHFRVLIVSAAFRGLSTVDRHRLVNKALGAMFTEGLHALSLRTLAPEEGDRAAGFVSPECRGGSKAQ